jgi:putative transposase
MQALLRVSRLLLLNYSQEKLNMDTSYQEKMALFRYEVIRPLLNSELTLEQEKQAKSDILVREWKYPDGSSGRVKGRTLRHWLKKYRSHGLDGLFYANKQPVSTKGSCRAIPAALLEHARKLREEDPRRSVEQVLDIMQFGQSLDVGCICSRTLMRYFKRLGLKRGRRVKGKGQHERYEQFATNHLWHGDTAHTFMLADPNNPGQLKKAKLIVLIDDASRICPHGEFYFDEKLKSVIDCFAKALMKRGKPVRILLDNAKTFRSSNLAIMCAELGVELNFCRPRRPQGKGKIERFIRTVKESFCAEAQRAANITTLEELNAAFQGWLERYSNREHDQLNGLTPEGRWRQDEFGVDRSLTESQILRAMMLRSPRTVHISTALVFLDNREYQVSRDLAGQDIEIRWNPEKVEHLEVWKDGQFVETALLKERKPHVEKDWREIVEEEPKASKTESATAYCEALIGDRLSERSEAGGKSKLLTLQKFEKLLATRLGREASFEEEEVALISQAFKRLAPLEAAQTEQIIMQTIEEKDAFRHVRYYLERLEPRAFRR